jgi:RNA polymerase sigma-70 factor (ECF subfamily)
MDVAVRMLGVAGEAAEAVQTGFVRAYLSIGKLRRPERFEVWLLRIIANAAVSQARSARRRARNIEIAPDYEDKKTPGPVQAGAAEDLKEAVSRAMLELSKKEAKAISLFGLQDLSHKEAAEIMDCSIEAVRWHVFKARQKLKVLLKDYL